MQIICSLVFMKNFIWIFISIVASLSWDMTQSHSALSSILVLKIHSRMKHSNIHENGTTLRTRECFFLQYTLTEDPVVRN